MSILVFGKTGQVAQELQRLVPDATCLGRSAADLDDPDACAQAITAHGPRAVINAAAYTAVDRAEEEEALATTINGAAPAAMARACARLDIPLVHISTDYVFDGQGTRAWMPEDAVAPINAYGRSKLAGEAGVIAAGGAHVILRTSWVFSAHGNNFVKTMLRLGQSRDALTVVGDQVGGPTSAASIAAACVAIADKLGQGDVARAASGIHHFAGTPPVSWADFARAVFDLSGDTVTVTDIPASDYPTPAARPANSRMDGTSLLRDFGIAAPDWHADLTEVIKELST
ncbi:dTDP-4-dehydrorhamnose reductase [uncultured Sulfitobacter sp.]|uniref:dTDP-4-dehydrorhamnose reductase n=1 Tax=uncultured Sulfitobacter sp. TaxID=191468 RepID=UPI00260957EF|nr:dTDP-4-dehydrorhamnose reductase [uncultured Sulfitobacter sp.]